MSTTLHTLAEINALSRQRFIGLLGPVFEKSPWVAAAAVEQRPFCSFEHLYQTLCDIVRHAPEEARLQLIRAQPELADRFGRGHLPAESQREPSSAGLESLTKGELVSLRRQNKLYRKRFGFPFIACARLADKENIFAALKERLRHTPQEEMDSALHEVFKIADLRLRDIIASSCGRLTTHVLDTSAGRPASGMKIDLWRRRGSRRKRLRSVRTNCDGRCDVPLMTAEMIQTGEYELIFFVGDYFASTERFLDRVPICFTITDPTKAYHVPLLCSPWSYTTYRES